MSGRFLLDTNIVIALSVNDEAVLENLDEDAATYVPSIVVGELFFGAYRSARVQENLARTVEFAANNTVLACDADTARRYGQVRNQLRRAGRPIPENDVWIAAIALQYDLTLVSRDSHFDSVESLEVEVW